MQWTWWGVPRMLAVRYWRHRLGRLMLMLVGLGAGAGLLLGVLLVNDALDRTYEGWARGTVGWADLEVGATTQDGFTQAQLGAVRALEGVGVAAPVIESRSYLFRAEAEASVTVRGVDPAAEQQMRPFSVSAGRDLEEGDRGVALLSHAAALVLDAGPGSDVRLITPFGLETLRVVGVYHPLSDTDMGSERALLLPLLRAQELFAAGRDAITRIDVAVVGVSVDAVEEQLSQLFGPQATVRRTAAAQGQLAAASAGLRSMLLLAGVLGVLAAALLIFVHVRMMAGERSDDLRLLQTLGVPAARVRSWLIIEVSLLVLLGALPAAALAGPFATVVLSNLPGQLLPFAATAAAPRLGSSVVSTQVVVVLLGVTALVLVARYLLVRLFGLLAQRLVTGRRLAPWLRVGGHLLTGRTGQAASVAAVLAFTMAGMIGVHGAAEGNHRLLTQWLDRAITWDARVAAGTPTSGVSVALPFETVQRLAAVPGVEAVSAERRTEVSSFKGPITMIALNGFGLELGNRLQVLQAADLSGSAMWLTLREGRGVAVSAPLAARLDITVGDVLPLSTGAGESEFTVVALVQDSQAEADAAYMALDNYSSLWGDQGVDTISLRLTPGVEATAVIDAVNGAQGAAHHVPLRVTLADAYRNELLAAAADTFRAARFMALLAFVVALVALANCSLAGAWQAEPELAGLRAMGVAGSTLVRVLVLELVLIGAVAAAAGVLLGTALVGRLSSSAALPAGAAWVWPLEAYAAVGALLALAGYLVALLLTARQRLSLR